MNHQPKPTTTPTSTTGLALTLPPAFEAFYLLHHPHYLTYAQAQLPPWLAHDAVRAAFGNLILNWTTLLTTINPAAHAWDHLSHEVRTRALATTTPGRAFEDDIRILTEIGFTSEATATMTGRDLSKIRYLTRTTTHPAP
ncbi:hypothetical protein ACIBEA_44200 [Streptomyces sp. NPDC051555]|uniref:hypothetical protein n=1 Tax=Streptomyces sp. NPDC051555 TaxID=3365657 RepID=UPI00379703F5